MHPENFFKHIPENLREELVGKIVDTGIVKIERIISRGHCSPKDFWYDQDQNAFVILLKGMAGLVFKDQLEPVTLKPGDWLNIPAHVKHQVSWTHSEEDTIWLAVFYSEQD